MNKRAHGQVDGWTDGREELILSFYLDICKCGKTQKNEPSMTFVDWPTIAALKSSFFFKKWRTETQCKRMSGTFLHITPWCINTYCTALLKNAILIFFSKMFQFHFVWPFRLHFHSFFFSLPHFTLQPMMAASPELPSTSYSGCVQQLHFPQAITYHFWQL